MKLALAVALVLTSATGFGQTYVLKAVIVDAGGKAGTSASYRANLSLGQAVASGLVQSSNYSAFLGFWHSPYGGGVAAVAKEIPRQQTCVLPFGISRNSPNPFRQHTSIYYSLPQEAETELTVLNPSGRAVATLVEGRQKPGQYRVDWSTAGVPRSDLPTGIYFVHLQAGRQTATQKLVKID
jgi:hypothetical protein